MRVLQNAILQFRELTQNAILSLRQPFRSIGLKFITHFKESTSVAIWNLWRLGITVAGDQ
jgi:hypothetical protein